MNAEFLLLNEMRRQGLAPAKPIALVCGHLVRFKVQGDKAGSRNGWAVFHGTWGVFGSWRTAESFTWFERPASSLTTAERDARAAQMKAARDEQARQQEAAHKAARSKASDLWKQGRQATGDHPYLKSKGVRAYGLRQMGDALMVPVRDEHGVMHSLQFIQPDGTKRFLTGGRLRGCYFALGQVQRRILIAEGMATAATLFEATGQATAAAFNCGNLAPVARALRAKFPQAELVICADNDINTPGNPGLSAAIEAAKATGALLAVPDFTEVTS